jgi:hypothetical protein
MDQDQEKMRSLMMDHIDGNLTGELGKYVENHINKSKEAMKEYEQLKEIMNLIEKEEELEPDPEGRDHFLEMLETEKKGSTSKGQDVINLQLRWNTLYKVAAAIALIVVGFLGGKMINQNNDEMQALQQELQETKELVLLSMMKQESASERIKGVMASYDLDQGDEEIVNALINAMNTDDNINVRIASLEALGRFSLDVNVRTALIESLSTQEFPAVQIRLIDLLVAMGDQRAVDPLQQVATDEAIIQSVRDQAQMGIFKLM